MQNHIAQNTKLILTPRRAALLAGFDNQLDILVRLQAPDAPVEARKERPPTGSVSSSTIPAQCPGARWKKRSAARPSWSIGCGRTTRSRSCSSTIVSACFAHEAEI